jgi:putative ABC transport system permease protein
VLWSWNAAAEQAATDRIGTRHKVSFIMRLPARYAEEVRQTPGVKQVAHASWFGAKDPAHPNEFFGTIAVEPADFLAVYDEIVVPPEQVEAWKQNRKGALVGDAIAKKLGWKVGDKIHLQGTIYPGDWEFEISGIYTAKRATVDRSTLWFQYKYMNESLPPREQDQVGWIMARIDNPGQSAAISRQIDQKFSERDIQTISMSEQALQASFLGMVSAIMKVVEIVSIAMLLIMTLMIGNTIAMGVRERTQEYGVLRAIGFMPRHIVLFIVGESAFLGLIGGTIGLAVGYPFVEKMLGRVLEENAGAFFPFFRVSSGVAIAAFLLALLIGVLAALLPARGAARLEVVSALRRVG